MGCPGSRCPGDLDGSCVGRGCRQLQRLKCRRHSRHSMTSVFPIGKRTQVQKPPLRTVCSASPFVRLVCVRRVFAKSACSLVFGSSRPGDVREKCMQSVVCSCPVFLVPFVPAWRLASVGRMGPNIFRQVVCGWGGPCGGRGDLGKPGCGSSEAAGVMRSLLPLPPAARPCWQKGVARYEAQ